MKTTAIENLVTIKDLPFPEGENFRDIVVTGPPGCGKTTLVDRLGGWPEEGYLDLAQKNWWRNRLLTFRPREVHFGLPFWDHESSHSVFDKEWLENPTPLQTERILIPPEGKPLLSGNWLKKFHFYFLLPPADEIFALRLERGTHGTHPVDVDLTLDIVRRQSTVYRELAVFFHRSGMRVIVSEAFGGEPRYIV